MKYKNKLFGLIGCLSMILMGCTNENVAQPMIDSMQIGVYAEEISKGEEIKSDEINQDCNVMYVYGQNDYLVNYDSLERLIRDAEVIARVRVTGLESKNVRSYIYTSYNVELIDRINGDISKEFIVNLPGGKLEGQVAAQMIKEITEGKDAGDLSYVESVVSDGDTDRVLQIGDEAVLFLIKESDNSFAVVGEYVGVALIVDGMVDIDKQISRIYESDESIENDLGEMNEDYFISIIYQIVEEIK